MATRHRHKVLPNVLRNDVEISAVPAVFDMIDTITVNRANPKRNHSTDGFLVMNVFLA